MMFACGSKGSHVCFARTGRRSPTGRDELNSKIHAVFAVAALFGCATAQAALIYSAAAPSGSSGALSFTSTSGSVSSPITGSVSGVRLAPLTVGASAPYSVISTGGSATISFAAPVSAFSFVWGSPDDYNFLDIVANNASATFSGTNLGTLAGFTANGSNANTRLFTVAGNGGTLIKSLTFRSNGIAFEVAAAPVPAPGTAWLLLAGLMGLIGLGRRRER